MPAAPASAVAEGKGAVPARKGFQDPMERLRERLAAKLGGGKLDGSDPGLVRVVNRGSSPGAAAAGCRSPRSLRSSAARAARR